MNRSKTSGIESRKALALEKNRIDDEQAKTVEAHFQLIMADDSPINGEHFNVTPDDLPDWLDDRLFKIGQGYFTKNILGMSSAYLAGLFAVLIVPDINEILVSTNKSSTPCTAFTRYLQTLLHVYNLHIEDYRDPDSKFYKSLNTIRWKHSTNSKFAIKRRGSGITQRQMVLTQFGFVGYVLLSADLMALTNEPDEREGINHFWRVLGHLLGIPARLNICRSNERETTRLCERVRDEVYKRELQAPNENFFLLASSALDGLQCVDVMLDIDAFMTFFYDINSCEYDKKIGIYSRCNYWYRKLTFAIIRTPIIGTPVRCFWNVYFRCMYWLQQRYPLVAWLKYGKDKSKITLYPTLT